MFIVTEAQPTYPYTYKLKDTKGEKVIGTFYEPELQKTDQDLFRIEKILRWKVVNGKRFGRVKWQGYDFSYNSWEPEENIKHLKDI